MEKQQTSRQLLYSLKKYMLNDTFNLQTIVDMKMMDEIKDKGYGKKKVRFAAIAA